MKAHEMAFALKEAVGAFPVSPPPSLDVIRADLREGGHVWPAIDAKPGDKVAECEYCGEVAPCRIAAAFDVLEVWAGDYEDALVSADDIAGREMEDGAADCAATGCDYNAAYTRTIRTRFGRFDIRVCSTHGGL